MQALPGEILYLIAQALPRPKWVDNLARSNKQSCHYLQPAFFQCDVASEARQQENFDFGTQDDDGAKNGIPDTWTGHTRKHHGQC